MFAPHHPVRSMSPQRRQPLPTAVAASQSAGPKTHLGSEGAASIGPQKLFTDLKQTSSQKAESSSAKALPFGSRRTSPSRAFADKNSQSPSRNSGASNGNVGPSVPTKAARHGSQSVAEGKQKASASVHQADQKPHSQHLVSPNKVSARVDAIFGGSISPSKRKKNKAPREVPGSPTKSPPLGPSISPQKTPQNKHPNDFGYGNAGQKTPVASHQARPSAFVTPASNIGDAGAARLRMGEMLDALQEQRAGGEGAIDEANADNAEQLTEEELYPEIEYMPPRVEVAHELPPALDGLPRAAEMGAMLASLQYAGCYKPSSSEIEEEKRLRLLRDAPERIDLEPEDECSVGMGDAINVPWPDLEVESCKTSVANHTKAAVATRLHPPGSNSQALRKLPSHSGRPTASSAGSAATKSASGPSKRVFQSRLPVSRPGGAIRTTLQGGKSTSSSAALNQQDEQRAHPPYTKVSKQLVTSQRRPLLSDKSNTQRSASKDMDLNADAIKKKVAHPALTDFENDRLGKSVRAKREALEELAYDVQGFSL